MSIPMAPTLIPAWDSNVSAGHPRDAELEVAAAAAFSEERRHYYADVAEEADELRAFLALEDEADLAQRRAEGGRWARVIGTATEIDLSTTGRLWEVLLYSPNRDHRERAAAILCRALRRGREREGA